MDSREVSWEYDRFVDRELARIDEEEAYWCREREQEDEEDLFDPPTEPTLDYTIPF